MSTITTIQNGVGFYGTSKKNEEMDRYDSMEFVSWHCVNQELYQDIKNQINRLYASKVHYLYKINKPRLRTRMLVNDAHRTMTICVSISYVSMVVQQQLSRECGNIYLSLTEDGLITDILDERPNMNPSVSRGVASTFH